MRRRDFLAAMAAVLGVPLVARASTQRKLAVWVYWVSPEYEGGAIVDSSTGETVARVRAVMFTRNINCNIGQMRAELMKANGEYQWFPGTFKARLDGHPGRITIPELSGWDIRFNEVPD